MSTEKLSPSKKTSISTNLHSLETCSTDKLRTILKQLENEYDVLEVKNEELANHISDMRTVIKHVQKEKTEELNYMLEKKQKLKREIERSEAALKIANSSNNTMYSDMLAFKNLNS